MEQQPVLEFIVRGTPAPQGSKSAFRNRHTGRIQQVESSKKVKPWRSDVRDAALAEIDRIEPNLWRPVTGPLVLSMTFSVTRPRGHYGTGRNAGKLKASSPMWPAVRPDLSKLIRSTEDALTDVVWADDAQIVGYLHLAKVYADIRPNYRKPDALSHPGAVIRVWHIPEAWMDPRGEKFATVMEVG